MDDRNNTIFGWVLGGCIVALGLGSLTGQMWKGHAPEKMGYAVEGGGDSAGGADAGPSIEALLQTADLAKGEQAFSKCAACHTVNQGGANGIGPNLWGVMGTKIATHVPGFAYSEALKSHDGDWDWANMDAWLTSPRRFANGTKMSFAGMSNPEERANLIAYMNAQGSNLPLPPPPAPAEETAEDAAPAEEGDATAASAEPAGETAPAEQADAAAPTAG